MTLPEQVFILARVPAGGPREDALALYSVPGPDGRPLTPVFSSMTRVAAFLQAAQDLGERIPLDYVFPATKTQVEDLGDFVPVLDPPAEQFVTPRPGPP